MSVVGSLIFCQTCGNLLPAISEKTAELKCDLCRRIYDTHQFQNLKVVTETAENAFPSSLKAKRSAVKTTLEAEEFEDGAIIKEKCPECGNDEMQFQTLQLRSADEGATVFYTCTKCQYKFRQANWAIFINVLESSILIIKHHPVIIAWVQRTRAGYCFHTHRRRAPLQHFDAPLVRRLRWTDAKSARHHR